MKNKYLKKLIDAQFKDISDMRWYETIAVWCIDSQYRKYKRMDKFLAEQLRQPAFELIDMAQKLRGRNVYDTVYRIEDWVYRNFRYKTDKNQYNKLEYWGEAKEVLGKKADDCDGLNSLIWILCILAGVDNDMVYSVVGKTSAGGHFWCLFFDARRARMVKLDATYYPEVKTIARKSAFKIGTKYTKVDFIFNDERIYAFR